MTSVSMTMPVGRQHVFDVLADGWLYVCWVVGASHIRDVDDKWPAEGTRLHHSVGVWPLMGHDVTVVRAVEPPAMLEMEAKLWPFGSARIRLDLKEIQPGRTEVTMTEHGMSGFGRLIPGPVESAVLVPRNRESLTRLCHLAVGRAKR
ncbi:SRPBCC family protein [Kibdelosporangium persicum]|uniref:Polyketide cyclase / dehydrase and lipid transport n=1 Tax=Kibdelosporangium persicum TaxID=2698649 RepID=A0ABX2F7D9_9PSEU|nr:SRPBCC family protein [Kibdelosporangium persicum]NRN66841.1 Polyketide cyclase / dehydrase and lipid transport [Kibdelosporangium persicum]